MSDPTPTPTPKPQPDKPKQTHGDIDKQILADIKLAETVATAAADPDHAPALNDEGVAATDTANLAQFAADARSLAGQAVAAKKLHLDITLAEDKTAKTLIAALRDIQARAKRKFPKDKPRQAAYCIGKKNFGRNRTGLEQDATNIIKLAGADALPGMTPAKLTAAGNALTAWVEADTDQSKAAENVSKLLTALDAKVAVMNDARRNIQGAADTAWPPTDPASAPIRRAFQIPVNKPYAS